MSLTGQEAPCQIILQNLWSKDTLHWFLYSFSSSFVEKKNQIMGWGLAGHDMWGVGNVAME